MQTRNFFLLLAGPTLALAQQFTITTVAGGAPPATPATAASTPIGIPGRVAVDGGGNVYFSASHSVFRVSSNGALTLVAGNSRPGFSGDGGAAINAQLNSPQGLAFDGAGNLYIADAANNRVRIVDRSGIINTFAGVGTASFGTGPGSFNDGAPATQAYLRSPKGVAVDKSGNVFIADTGDNIIRKVTTDGIINSFAGDGYPGFFDKPAGTAINSEFDKPSDIALDSSGNLYVADTANNVIRKISADGATISTFAGTGSAGTTGDNADATKGNLFAPMSITFDGSGNLYILQNADGRIRKVDTKNVLTTLAGSGTPGFADGSDATKAQFNFPTGLAIDGSGNLYVADSLNLRIRKIAGSTVSTIAGNGQLSYSGDNGPALAAQLSGPQGVAVDAAGNLYVADTANDAVRMVSKAGTIANVLGNGQPGSGNNQLNGPAAVAADAAGNVYIADTQNSRVLKVSGGSVSTLAGSDQLYTPTGVAVDSSGNVYVADLSRNAILRIGAGGVTTLVGSGLNGPRAVAVDTAGNVYFADAGNYVIRKLTPGGQISTVAGNSLPGYSGDAGSALSAQIGAVVSLAVDSSGNLFFSDGSRIREVLASGLIRTLTGTAGSGYSGDGGLASSAQVNSPTGIAVDSTGALYVADTGNNAVRKLQPSAGGLNVAAIASGASLQPGVVAPGEIVVLFGSGMGPATLTQFQLNAAGNVPTTVGGTTVFFNGQSAPVLYTSANQVAVVTPFNVTGPKADVVVTFQGQVSAAFSVSVADTAPALFTLSGGGSGAAVAVNQDGSINDAAHPAKAGTTVTLYATGAGRTNPASQDGAPATQPLPLPVAPVSVTIGGKQATIKYAGAAPGLVAGLLQVNADIPAGLTAGAVPVVLQAGTSSSPNGVTIFVAQ